MKSETFVSRRPLSCLQAGDITADVVPLAVNMVSDIYSDQCACVLFQLGRLRVVLKYGRKYHMATLLLESSVE